MHRMLSLASTSALAVASTFLLPTPVGAAEAELPTELVVTATRTAISADEAIAPVTVLNRADIDRLQPQSLPELLRQLPGVDVRANGGRGQLSSVFVRGANSDQVLVLVDGVRIYGATNHTTRLELLPVQMVERVEVLRGPRASLYGAEAAAGVIQIFTRQFDGQPNTRIEVGAGNDDSKSLSVLVGGRYQDTQASLQISRESSKGYDISTSGAVDDDNDGFDNTSVNANVRHQVSDAVEVSGQFLRAEGLNEFDPFSGTANVIRDFRQQALAGRLFWDASDVWSHQFQLAESRDDSVTLNSPFGASVFNTRRREAGWQAVGSVAANHTLSVGVDYARDVITSSTVYDEDSRITRGLFGQWQGGAGPLAWVVAVRRDDNSAFGDFTTGNIDLALSLSRQWRLVAAYGEGYKAPDFNELYFPLAFGFGGNPDLRPEESRSWEVGVVSSTGFELRAFRTLTDDLINNQFDAVNNVTLPVNIAKARAQGLELAYRRNVWGFDLALSGTYVDARDLSNDQQLIRRAQTHGQFSIDRRFCAFSAGASFRAQSHTADSFTDPLTFQSSRVRLPGYGLVDVRLAWEVNSQWSVRLTVDNALNRKYQSVAGFRAPERQAMVWLRYQLR